MLRQLPAAGAAGALPALLRHPLHVHSCSLAASKLFSPEPWAKVQCCSITACLLCLLLTVALTCSSRFLPLMVAQWAWEGAL